MKYFYTPKNADFLGTSFRAMYEDDTRCVIEYNEGAIDDSWRESTLGEIEQDFGFNPFEQKEPEPQPTEQELVQAEMLLNQIEIMQRQNEQDEVLAEILLNQMGV